MRGIEQLTLALSSVNGEAPGVGVGNAAILHCAAQRLKHELPYSPQAVETLAWIAANHSSPHLRELATQARQMLEGETVDG